MIAAEISRTYMEEELRAISPLVQTFGWEIENDLPALRLTTRIRSCLDMEIYVVEMTCNNYKAWPPYIEFIEWDSGKRGTKRAYPKDGRGYFHSNPCVCAPFSRKAYNQFGGPHGDWNIDNWISLTPAICTLGDIFLLFQRLINDSTVYQGRMER